MLPRVVNDELLKKFVQQAAEGILLQPVGTGDTLAVLPETTRFVRETTPCIAVGR
jgi:hypothetical protein